MQNRVRAEDGEGGKRSVCLPITCQCTPQSHVSPFPALASVLAQMKWLRHDSDSGFVMPHSHLICMPTRREWQRERAKERE